MESVERQYARRVTSSVPDRRLEPKDQVKQIVFSLTGRVESRYDSGIEKKLDSKNTLDEYEWILKDFYRNSSACLDKDAKFDIVIDRDVYSEFSSPNCKFVLDTDSDKTFGQDYKALKSLGVLPYKKPWIGMGTRVPVDTTNLIAIVDPRSSIEKILEIISSAEYSKVLEPEENSQTTIVTGYMNMTSKHTSRYYLEAFEKFLARFDRQMIVYTDQQNATRTRNIRKFLGLGHLTIVKVIDRTFLTLDDVRQFAVKETPLVLKNGCTCKRTCQRTCQRTETCERHDPKREFDYLLATNSKCTMILDALSWSPGSRFAWLDFGLGSRGYDGAKDIEPFYKILDNPRQGFSFGVIDDREIEYSTLMDGFRYCAAAGLITFEKSSVTTGVLHRWETEFRRAVRAGLCPMDESILYYLYKQTPELFSVFKTNYDIFHKTYLPETHVHENRENKDKKVL